MNKTGKKSWIAYLYILPMIVLSFVLVYYCIIDTVVVSFTDWDGMTDVFHFVALKNYIKMFKDHVFWTSVVNNLIFFVGTVFIQALLGFVLAVLLKKNFRGLMYLRLFILCRLQWLLLLLLPFSELSWTLQTER